MTQPKTLPVARKHTCERVRSESIDADASSSTHLRASYIEAFECKTWNLETSVKREETASTLDTQSDWECEVEQSSNFLSGCTVEVKSRKLVQRKRRSIRVAKRTRRKRAANPTEFDPTLWDRSRQVLNKGVAEAKQRYSRVCDAVAQNDFDSLRNEVVDIAHLGGPEAAGAWGALKITTGVGLLLVTGHVVAGGAMCVWGGMAVATATAWGLNREDVHKWLAGTNVQEDSGNEAGVEGSFEEF